MALCVGLTVLILGFAAESITEYRTGRSLDPTDPMNFNRYTLVDDLVRTVYVRECSDESCRGFVPHEEWERVESGHGAQVQLSWGPDATYTYAVAYRPETPVARCLRIAAVKHAEAATVGLSASTSCA